MTTKIFHGRISPQDVGRKLIASFNRGNLRAQKIGAGDQVVVQIATDRHTRAGGQTAITVTIQQVEDGVSVQVGNQAWMGVAASLGKSALSAFRNPFSLIGRLDDIAQDIESLQLTEKIWEEIKMLAKASGASYALSERLQRITCLYCSAANPVGEPSCLACGAPMGDAQPRTCANCGFVVFSGEGSCPNCGNRL